MSLSVCIITLNEQDNLPRCLESVAGLAAQVVVVDSLSTDDTQRIARDAGAEVIERPFEGHVLQKQFALEQAREEWVLCLDADEWLDDELREAVRGVITANTPGGANGHELNRRNLYLGAWIDHCGWSPEWRLRLVRRSEARWTGADPHDRLEVNGARARLAGRLRHRPYRDLADHLGTINRYTDIMVQQRLESDRDTPPLAMLLRPPARFLKMYVLRAGFLDGWRGFVVSAMGAFYVFLKYAKLRAARQADGAGASTTARESNSESDAQPAP